MFRKIFIENPPKNTEYKLFSYINICSGGLESVNGCISDLAILLEDNNIQLKHLDNAAL